MKLTPNYKEVEDPYQLRYLDNYQGIHAVAPRRRQFFSQNNSHVPIFITAREPIPLDREKLSIAHLSSDIVRCILDSVQDSNPEDIPIVASTSSSLYMHARYVQHRVVHINLDKRTHIRDRLDLITRYNLHPAIRRLQLSGKERDKLQEETNEILSLLSSMIPAMTGLLDLDWKVGRLRAAPIPVSILESLPSTLRLHTSLFCHCDITGDDDSGFHAQAREFLSRLSDNQNLFTLSIRIVFLHEEECIRTMRALKAVLLSCPNLLRLPAIDIWYPRDRCYGYDGPEFDSPYCGLGLSDGERPQALEELGISYYPWGHQNISPFRYFAIGYPEKGTEKDYWARTFDWSRLVKLNEIPPELDPIVPKLTGLREVEFDHLEHIDHTEFLNELTSTLESLSIVCWENVGSRPDPIIRHGATLRKLRVHRRILRDINMTSQDIVQLCKGLPHLEELAIDIARDEVANDWPYEALDAIASLPSVRTIELWFNLGCPRPRAPTPFVAPAPFLTVSSSRRLFSYLHERNKNIRRLILHSGAPWHESWDGHPTWDMQNSMTFVCTMVYACGEEGGSIRVTCPDLGRALNAELEHLDQVDRDWSVSSKLDPVRVPLKVALDGPLTEDEWESWYYRQRVPRERAHPDRTTILRRFIIGPLRRMWRWVKR